MTIRVGINGFGRIGRNFLRAAKVRGADIDFVAANDLLSKELMAHLLRYDTILGTWDVDVSVTDDGISIGGDALESGGDEAHVGPGDRQPQGVAVQFQRCVTAPGQREHEPTLVRRDHAQVPIADLRGVERRLCQHVGLTELTP